MGNCKTCVHWQTIPGHIHGECAAIKPAQDGGGIFKVIPDGKMACVNDIGDEYFAGSLYTMPNFGCALHKLNPEERHAH